MYSCMCIKLVDRRVLTNTENLAMIKEEERKKEEKDKEKREKQEARRAKALMKSQPGL